MADPVLPATGTGTANLKVAAKTLASGANVEQVEIVVATEGGTATQISPLTDTQLRATAVPVSMAAAPTGAATEATLATASGTLTAQSTLYGGVTETAPATDTASSGLNGRLQRIAQRLTSIIGLLPTALGANGGLKIEGVASGTAVPISGTITTSGTMPISAASLPLPTGAATETTLAAVNTKLAGTLTVTGGSTPTDLTATGTLTALNQTVGITTLNGMAQVQVDISGTFSASWNFEGTVDGTNWISIPKGLLTTENTGGTYVGSNLSAGSVIGNYIVNIAGLAGFRVKCAAYTSGTVTLALRASAASNVFALTSSLPTGANVIGKTITTMNGTTAVAGNGVSGTGVQRVTLASDGTGQVTLAAGAATIGALAANQSVNQAQVAGTTVDTNSGSKSAGTQRVVIATDQPSLTNALKVDGSAVTQPVSGTVTANAGSGTQAVSLATAPALVAGSALIGKVGIDQTTPGTTDSVSLKTPTATLANGAQVSMTTSAADLVTAGTYKSILLRNLSTSLASVFIGTTGVTATTGMEIKPGEMLSFGYGECPSNVIRGLTAASTATVIAQATS